MSPKMGPVVTTGAAAGIPEASTLGTACDFGVLLTLIIEELDKCRTENRPPTACLLARLNLQLARAKMLVFPLSASSAAGSVRFRQATK